MHGMGRRNRHREDHHVTNTVRDQHEHRRTQGTHRHTHDDSRRLHRDNQVYARPYPENVRGSTAQAHHRYEEAHKRAFDERLRRSSFLEGANRVAEDDRRVASDAERNTHQDRQRGTDGQQ